METIKLSKHEYELLQKVVDTLNCESDRLIIKGLFEEEKDCIEIPFDIDKAKEGLPVKTKSGYDVRIICWDKLGDYPIVGLVKRDSDKENVVIYDRFGIPVNSPVEVYALVLVVKKRRVWVNIYQDENGCIQAAVPNFVGTYKVLDTVQVSYFPK